MNTTKRTNRTAAGVTAAGVALALMGTLLMTGPALAASDDSSLGAISVTLDFTDPNSFGLTVVTENRSDVPANGYGSVTIPSGKIFKSAPSTTRRARRRPTARSSTATRVPTCRR